MKAIISLFLFVLVSFLAAMPGAFFKPGDWYKTLAKPAWTPPPWVFAPVWTLLYLSMGASAWLVFRSRHHATIQMAMALFFVQLVLNAFWSVIFFGWHKIGWALFEICLFWFVVMATMVSFWQVNAGAGALLIPYLVWLSVAFSLNLGVWRMNR